MFCSKCGDLVEKNEIFCNKCGNKLNSQSNIKKTKNQNFKMIIIGCGFGIAFLTIIIICALIFNYSNYYFSYDIKDNNEYEVAKNNQTSETTKKNKYQTAIIADNRYSGVTIIDKTDALELISDDSVIQKSNCPIGIKKIEDEIISKYNIQAVNLCEIDIELAKEINKLLSVIYKEYPTIRGYLTNLTIINTSISEDYIAAFLPMFEFATSDTTSGYPIVLKTQVLLNSKFFLNLDRLNYAIIDSSSIGHFPKNATIYSPIAHEWGHYLSFLAMMKHYDVESILLYDSYNETKIYQLIKDFSNGDFSLSMIETAFDNYQKENNTTMSIDEWRSTISNYAVARDNSGQYIYDETIAESFHDVYLNGQQAQDASKYIVEVLKKKLGEL